MPLTLEQLRTPTTESEALDWCITVLSSLGFNATSWQSGSVQRLLVQLMARVYSEMTNIVAALVDVAFNDTSTGSALTAFSDSHYDNQRVSATYTEGTCLFTNTGGIPHIVAADQVVVADSINSYQYRNTVGFTIPAGGSQTATMRADVAGANRNVANNTITVMVTSLAATTVNNPDPGTGTWITTLGADAESDATLQTRNTSKWAVLSYATPGDGYVQMALTSTSAITRVRVNDAAPGGAGTVWVYTAGATGVSAAADVTLAQTYIDTKRPCCSDVTVYAASAQAQNFAGTIYVDSTLNNATKQAEIEDAIDDYINGLDIGGTVLPPGSTGYMLFSELLGAITGVTGVSGVVLTTPTADVIVNPTSVMTVGGKVFTYTSI